MSADTLQTGDGDCEKRDLGLNYADLKKQNEAQSWRLLKNNLIDCDTQTLQILPKGKPHSNFSYEYIWDAEILNKILGNWVLYYIKSLLKAPFQECKDSSGLGNLLI